MKHVAVLLIIVVLSLSSSLVHAGEGTAGDYMEEIGTKFGRGLLNIVTSPAEIPCTMAIEMEEERAPGFFVGLGRGTILMLRRILVGVTEVGTFMIPMERTLPPVCHEET